MTILFPQLELVLAELNGIRVALERIADSTERKPQSAEVFVGSPINEEEKMPTSVTMKNKQKCPAGVRIVDEDGQPFATKPDDVMVSFVSSDPTVADFVPDANGLTGFITSGLVGTCVVSAHVTLPNGTEASDDVAVAIEHTDPAAVTFAVGTPVDE